MPSSERDVSFCVDYFLRLCPRWVSVFHLNVFSFFPSFNNRPMLFCGGWYITFGQPRDVAPPEPRLCGLKRGSWPSLSHAQPVETCGALKKENRNGIGGIFKKKRERRSHDDKRKEKSLFWGFLLSLGSPSEYGGEGGIYIDDSHLKEGGWHFAAGQYPRKVVMRFVMSSSSLAFVSFSLWKP